MGLTTRTIPADPAALPFPPPYHLRRGHGRGRQPPPRPGEISLAHHGVLFLDELPEFHKDVVEVLRQPMEEGKVTVVRSAASETYPSHFMLLCAMNPLQVRLVRAPVRRCRCTPAQVKRYLGKLSGPMLDRIDLFSEVPPLEFENLADRSPGEPSAAIRARVTKARERQSNASAPTAPTATPPWVRPRSASSAPWMTRAGPDEGGL
ncbi:MAG: ATP-binding protein [Evtepia sp.]